MPVTTAADKSSNIYEFIIIIVVNIIIIIENMVCNNFQG